MGHAARALLRLASSIALAVPGLGCAPAEFVNALVPKDGYRVEPDLAYGPHPRQHLDVYVPDGLEEPAPVVVFLYGGRWDTGAKADYLFVGQALSAEGMVAVVPDYRLYPEVRFPTFVEDGAAAVRWVVDHAQVFGGDPGRVFLMGHSAGAHIAAMLALDPRYLGDEGLAPARLAGLIGLAGPYDFLPIIDPVVKRIFAAEDMAATQPITFANGAAPPALLLHGGGDRTVRPGNSLRLAEKIAAAGGSATAHLYEDLGHIAIVGALAAPFRWRAPVLADVAAFVRGGRRPELRPSPARRRTRRPRAPRA